MLRRLIGENIAMTVTGDADLSCVSADPGQMDQVIMGQARQADLARGQMSQFQKFWPKAVTDARREVQKALFDKGGGQAVSRRARQADGFGQLRQVHAGLRDGLYNIEAAQQGLRPGKGTFPGGAPQWMQGRLSSCHYSRRRSGIWD